MRCLILLKKLQAAVISIAHVYWWRKLHVYLLFCPRLRRSPVRERRYRRHTRYRDRRGHRRRDDHSDSDRTTATTTKETMTTSDNVCALVII